MTSAPTVPGTSMFGRQRTIARWEGVGEGFYLAPYETLHACCGWCRQHLWEREVTSVAAGELDGGAGVVRKGR